jgi:hypothetical protein
VIVWYDDGNGLERVKVERVEGNYLIVSYLSDGRITGIRADQVEGVEFSKSLAIQFREVRIVHQGD